MYTLSLLSLSAWRAWIEIVKFINDKDLTNSRSPLGERGLKYILLVSLVSSYSVALRLESVD